MEFRGLNEMAIAIYEGNKAKGFWDKERNVGETLMLIVTELAEALEAHRKGRMAADDSRLHPTKEEFEELYKDTFEDEIADAMIRIFDFCGGTGIDLDFHIEQKVKYNSTRERLHGKQY
jgi:NTP pyrophosphatase (non-canonical NTP hydrolase)